LKNIKELLDENSNERRDDDARRFATDIKAAGAAGFDYVEIWAAKLREFLKKNTVAELKKLIEENNLEPYSINSIEHITFRNTDDYEKIKTECEDLSRIAAEINCPYVVVVPGKLPERATKRRNHGRIRPSLKRACRHLPQNISVVWHSSF
jgi:sugar phosphate isomerase/epimerase